jgi:hypothetical protein
MIEISLQPIPNQAFSIILDDAWFQIRIKTLENGSCVVSIDRDNLPLIGGVRAMPNRALLPYFYLEGGAGNFAFVTDNDEYPNYTKFGTAHRMIYASAEELEALRNG